MSAHECEMKLSTSPRLAACVLALSPESVERQVGRGERAQRQRGSAGAIVERFRRVAT